MRKDCSVLLIDDHGLVRHGMQLLINRLLPEVRVELAGSLREALELLARSSKFDLALLDLTLGDVHGTAGLRRLRDDYPYLSVVVMTAQDDRETVQAALEAGAMGFISKAASPDELKMAFKRVLIDRSIHLPKSISDESTQLDHRSGRDLSELSKLDLTPREIEVLGMVVRGLRNKEIARKLAISEIMVKKHVSASLKALGVHNRTMALIALSKRGYSVPSVTSEAN